METIKCPFHEEATASCVLYEVDYHCFGCGAHGPLSEIGREAVKVPKEKYVENLREKLKYIDSLPRKLIRGFELPYDNLGYYLVWSDRDYYKYRVWDPDAKNKYRCPAGHSKPIFWADLAGNDSVPVSPRTLMIVEGEFNALSLAAAFPEWNVCSPGSASDFVTPKTRNFLLTYCTSYCTVVIIADRDGPGTKAVIDAKAALVGKVPNIPIVLMAKDANELLVEVGKEGLRKIVKESLPHLREGAD